MKKTTVVKALTVFILLIASLALIGWSVNSILLISFAGNMTAMNPFTALSFLLLSAVLFIRIRSVETRAATQLEILLAIVVCSIGGGKLLEYVHVSDLHFDQWLFTDRLRPKLLHNAIAPTTAFLFLLSGLLLLNANVRYRFQRSVGDLLIVLAFLIAYLGAVGYIYSLEPFYRIGPFVPMALNTALCFLSLFIALFMTLPAGGLATTFFSVYIGGKLARRAIPLMLLIPPAFGYFRLFVQREYSHGEYSIVLDTGILLLLIIISIYYYASVLNKNDFSRKKAEAEIKESEEKYRTLIFAMKEGVIYFNKEGRILFYNTSFAQMTGYEIYEVVGKHVVDVFITQEGKERSYKRLNERLHGIAEDYEGQLLHKDGRKIWVSVTARAIIADGEPRALFSTIVDITERKKKEEDIEAFSASAAHDLNAPLARIEAMADMVMDNNSDVMNKDDAEFMHAIVKTAAEARSMLNDLLEFSRISADKVKKVQVDMNEMVEEVVKNNIYLNPDVNIEMERLPDALGDPVTIKQVWTNLILNAIKYSSKTPAAKIWIGSMMQDGVNVYMVKDNGAGFDMANYPKLFVPFKRLHSNFEGNGLGLPITRRIVEKHGGRIWAEGKLGQGAVFYFTL